MLKTLSMCIAHKAVGQLGPLMHLWAAIGWVDGSTDLFWTHLHVWVNWQLASLGCSQFSQLGSPQLVSSSRRLEQVCFYMYPGY